MFKHRHSIVKRRENLTESDQADLTLMLEYLPELARCVGSPTGSTGCSTHPRISTKRAAAGRDRARPGVPGRAGVGQGHGATEQRSSPRSWRT